MSCWSTVLRRERQRDNNDDDDDNVQQQEDEEEEEEEEGGLVLILLFDFWFVSLGIKLKAWFTLFLVLILRQDLIKLPREALKLWSSCLGLLIITSLCYQAWLLQVAKLNKLLLHSRQH